MSAPTITDVARHAGVAVSTVSYVLSGKRTISAGTRQRVMASIDMLGYHPHAGSRSAAARPGPALALVLPAHPEVHPPALMRQVTAVLAAARRFDHDVLLLTAGDDPARLKRIGPRSAVDGVVVLDVRMDDPRLPVLAALGRPCVLVGFPADPHGLACVGLDHHRAAGRCVEHLARLGHRRIALLGATEAAYRQRGSDAVHARAGFTAAAADAGLTGVVRACPESPDEVRAAVGALLADHPGLTGLVVANETALPHVTAALAALGRPAPDQMSVTAICADAVADTCTPAPSSVPVPYDEIGRQAVSTLMRALSGAAVPGRNRLTPEFVERAGTLPAWGTGHH